MTVQSKISFLQNHIVDCMTDYLMQDYGLELPVALKSVYESNTYRLLQDIEGSLYVQSPSYVYVLLKEELKNTRIVTPC